ncbi:MAG: phosphohydrolase, partial [Anaerotignum sp.]|nr:phosphohydrolase [Anaerotignum sp.]
KADLTIDMETKQIRLSMDVDTRYGSVMDYFEIFLGRMIMCRKAADKLGLQFRLMINGQSLI